MITDYDDGEGIIKPEMSFSFSGVKADVCLIIFSHEIYEHLLSTFECTSSGFMTNANGRIEIFSFIYKGKRIAFYLSYISSTCSSFLMEESHVITGAEKYIVFGSCGVLGGDAAKGKFIVPTSAYRDEGMSYHYLEPSDYVEMRNHSVVSEFFRMNRVPYIEGRTWTTDAFYRETKNKIEKRKAEGCIAVEMECAGLEAVSRFYGIDLYAFLVPGDEVAADEWRERENLSLANHSLDKLYLALQLAVSLC